MRTLVTGSSGFVGSALCAALAARGESVIGVDLRPPRAGALSVAGFNFVAADLTQPGAIGAAFAGPAIDRVVIAAAVTADRARELRDPASIVAVNTGAVAETIRCAASAGVSRIVHLSSAAVYGGNDRSASALDEETTLPAPVSLYAITKLAGESTALRLREVFGLDLVAGRLGTCFGPFEHESGARDTLSAPWQVLHHAAAGVPVSLPRPGRKDWLYIRDAVAAIIALLDAPRPLPRNLYNLSAGFEWTVAEWCDAIRRAYPGFEWSIGADANVDFYGDVDRASLSPAHLIRDTDFRPTYNMERALADYLATEPELIVKPSGEAAHV